MNEPGSELRKPPWIRVRLPSGRQYVRVNELKKAKSLHTVCEEALCPNIGECWSKGNATFLILGDTCSRDCRFCAVRHGKPEGLDWGEPVRVAEAVAAMGLKHVVITSVTRDDLPDGGAGIFAETIRQVHSRAAPCTVEVLIPDFKGDPEALNVVLEAMPEVLGHNVETVPRLYGKVRPQAVYLRSLEVLGMAKRMNRKVLSKSGFMVGLGESTDELLEVMDHLRQVGCDILSIGQYLRPTRLHLPVARYYAPEEFETLKKIGHKKGFRWVESGPLVRSSYGAEAQARELLAPWPGGCGSFEVRPHGR